MRAGRKARRVGSLVCAAALAVSTRAVADPNEAEKALADARFREGREAMEKKRTDEACTKFEESERLWERGGTALNLAACREAQGRVASAWAAYTRAIGLAQKEARADREEIAKRKVAELTPDLSWLVIVVPPALDAPDLVVTRNGVAVGRGAWGIPIPVDAGRQVVVASSAAVPSVEAVVDVGARDRRTVTLPAGSGPPRVLPVQPATIGFGPPPLPPVELGPRGVVRVHIDTKSPEVALFSLDNTYGGMVELTRQVCVTPCDAIVDARTGQNFFFAGDGVPPSEKFRMNTQSGDVTAHVSTGNAGVRVFSVLGISLGAVGVITGAVFLPIGLSMESSTSDFNGSEHASGKSFTTLGGVSLGVGGGLLVAGIVAAAFSGTSFKLDPPPGAPGKLGVRGGALVF